MPGSRSLLLCGMLLPWSMAQTACTSSSPGLDSCEYQIDGFCDTEPDGNGDIACEPGTDCYDCDPCQEFSSTSCSTCTSNPSCLWCSATGDCSSVPAFASTDTVGCEPSDFLGSDSCNACTKHLPALDDCDLKVDGICNTEPDDDENSFCFPETDCFDCDPCREFDLTSCSDCTANPGCLWCDANALCSSVPEFATGGIKKTGCATSDFGGSGSCSTSGNYFSDPLYGGQSWVFNMINVEAVWKMGITGDGVAVRVNDDGVAADHPDLNSKFDVPSSCEVYLPQSIDEDQHGTTCASIALASANNDACSVGIAPDASVSSCIAVGDNAIEDSSLLFYAPPGGTIDITSNSYGTDACATNRRRLRQASCPFSAGDSSPCTDASCAATDWSATIQNQACRTTIKNYCIDSFNSDVSGCLEFLDLFVESCSYNTLSPAEEEGIIKGITEGRDGKGIVHVVSSGNAFTAGQVVNMEGFVNSRLTISVAAVGQDGDHAPYSTPGVALFISAPGGNDDVFLTQHIVAKFGGGCQDGGVGTSFSTPVVTGVVALMLQANPDLTWRDVQGVLATTSQKVVPGDPTWITNGAGLHHSIKFGFGVVDALAAVQAAQTWVNFSAERALMYESGSDGQAISDYPSPGITSTISVPTSGVVVESVVVYLDIIHGSRGDLDISLTSPSGTTSLLLPGNRPENTQGESSWKLMTVRAWGETPTGDWKLSIVDISDGDCCGEELTVTDTLNSWSLLIYGHDDPTLTPAPVAPSPAPAVPSPAPAVPSPAPAAPTPAPAAQSPAPVAPSPAPAAQTPAPAAQSPAPAVPSPAPVAPSPAPAAPTPAPAAPTPAPAAPTPAPVAPTPAPVAIGTPAPGTPAPTPAPPPPYCFSGATKVTTKSSGVIQMKDLQLGEEVLVLGGSFEKVYSFGHKDYDILGEYMKLTTDKSALEISAQHMVYVAGKAIPAGTVKLGDMLQTITGPEEVKSVEVVFRKGAFAPFTKSGGIVVNEKIHASTFIAFQKSWDLHLFGSSSTKISFQWIAHSFEAPHRIYCEIFECVEETYENGVSVWVDFPHKVCCWVFEQHELVQLTTLVPFLAMMGVFAGIEIILQNPAVLVAGIAIGSRFLATYKKK